MKINIKRELLYVLISVIPFIYLAMIYHTLPETVATHFDFNGKPNGWSSRESLWFLPACLTIGFNLLFLFLPEIDPKRRLAADSGKFEHIRFIVVLFMAGLSCFILYVSENQHQDHFNKFLFAFLGLFFAALGNFFPSLKPNYFIGIRSPWALENETVWKRTHRMAGRLWVAGGLILIILAFALPDNKGLGKIALPLIILIAILPVVYSYVIWKKIQKTNQASNAR